MKLLDRKPTDYYEAVILPSARHVRPANIKSRRTANAITALMLALCVALLSLVGVFSLKQDARANPFDIGKKMDEMFCGDVEFFNTPTPRQAGVAELGLSMMTPASLAAAETPPAANRSLGDLIKGDATYLDVPRTAYEKFGMAGLWTVYRGGDSAEEINKDPSRAPVVDEKYDRRTKAISCMPLFELGGTAIGNAFLTMAKIALEGGNFVLSQAIFVPFMDDLEDVVVDVVADLQKSLYLPFINLSVMLGAVYLGWTGIVKKKNMETAQGFIWMVGAMILGAILINYPAALMSAATTFHTSVASAVLTNVGGDSEQADGLCALPPPSKVGGEEASSAAQAEVLVRTVSCSMWRNFIYTPWAVGQFGVSPNKLPVNENQAVTLGPGRVVHGLGIGQIQATVLSDDYLAGKDATELDVRWNDIVDEVMLSGNQEVMTSWSGQDPMSRISISLAALIVAIAAVTLIFVFGLTSIMLALVSSVLLILLPVVALIGVHPGLGRRVALQYAELLFGLLIKRIVYVILLAISLTVYSRLLKTASESGGSYMASIFIVIAFAAAMLMYRKTIIDLFSNVSLGSGMGTSQWTQPAEQGMKKVGGLAVGATLGAVTGGVGALAMGAGGAAAGAGAGTAIAGKGAAAMTLKNTAMGSIKGAASGGKRGAQTGQGVRSGLSAGQAQTAYIKRRYAEAQKANQRAAQSQQAQEEREAQKAAKTQASSDQRTAKQEARESSPEFMAKTRREEAANIRNYRRDYSDFGTDSEWTAAFEQKYGFPPVNPQTHDFPGYGRAQYNAATEHPRPRAQEKPAPKPGGDKAPGENSGGNSGPKMNKETPPASPQDSAPRPANRSTPAPDSMPKPEKPAEQPASTSMPRPTASTSTPGGTSGTRGSQQPPAATQRAGGMPRPGGR